MHFDLNKQIGPFPLKIWLVIGAGGIGLGFLVAKQFGNSGEPTNDSAALALPHTPSLADFWHVGLVGSDALPTAPGASESIVATIVQKLKDPVISADNPLKPGGYSLGEVPTLTTQQIAQVQQNQVTTLQQSVQKASSNPTAPVTPVVTVASQAVPNSWLNEQIAQQSTPSPAAAQYKDIIASLQTPSAQASYNAAINATRKFMGLPPLP